MIFAAMYGTDFGSYMIILLFTFVAVCIAMVLHEVAHGLVAKWSGDNTAKNMGRLSVDPRKHFDAVGFVMLMFVGFGYAKPVPVNPYNFKHYKRGLFFVSIAGIVTNIILALFAALFYAVMIYAVSHASTSASASAFGYFEIFFYILLRINLSLAFFNLLPIYPLDGFRIVSTFTKENNKYCSFMRTNGHFILLALVGLSFIISMAFSYVALPHWFSYIDVLGTYLDFFVGNVGKAFVSLWALMLPGV